MSYVILLVITIIAGNMVGYVLNFGFDASLLGIGNHLLGGGFGFCRGFIITLITIFLVQLTPLDEQSWWIQSRLVTAYQPAVKKMVAIVSPAIAKIEEKTKIGQTIKDTGTQLQQMIQ